MRMKAAIMFEQGRPRPYAESRPLVVEEVELDPPGPGEVLIEIAAAGLCHSDLSGIEGIRPRPVPIVIGHEGAGVVREVGEGVSDLAPGDHVVTVFVTSCGHCRWCVRGRPNICPSGFAARSAGTLASGAKRIRRLNGEAVNHGSGLSPEDAPHIFDAFHTTKERGLGLGLPICRTIAESTRWSR